MASVWAVIVTYNPDKELLLQQYKSLNGQVEGIVYVKNSDEKIEINAVQARLLIIRNDSNIGLASAQNQGIEYAIQQGAEYVLLLDHDSIPAEDMVPALLDVLQSGNGSIAAVGPVIADGFSCISDENPFTFRYLFGGLIYKRVPVNSEVTDVPYIIASGTLFGAEIFHAVGPMMDALFIDGVDQEWCLRARSMGFRIVVTAKGLLYHQLGNGITHRILSHSPEREFYIIRNNILMMRLKHIPIGLKVRKLIASLYRVGWSFVSGKRQYFREGIRGYVQALRTKIR